MVIEAVGGGGDIVAVTNFINYALSAGQEIELLQALQFNAVNDMNLTGNEFGQRIIGTSGVNTIDGKGGSDIMEGGLGSDTYYADIAADIVAEAVGGGTDTLYVAVTYKLGVGRSRSRQGDTLASTTTLNIVANEFNQAVYGNNGTNTLNGLNGDDRLYGYNGADFLYGGAGKDTLNGGKGNDSFVFNTG